MLFDNRKKSILLWPSKEINVVKKAIPSVEKFYDLEKPPPPKKKEKIRKDWKIIPTKSLKTALALALLVDLAELKK